MVIISSTAHITEWLRTKEIGFVFSPRDVPTIPGISARKTCHRVSGWISKAVKNNILEYVGRRDNCNLLRLAKIPDHVNRIRNTSSANAVTDFTTGDNLVGLMEQLATVLPQKILEKELSRRWDSERL